MIGYGQPRVYANPAPRGIPMRNKSIIRRIWKKIERARVRVLIHRIMNREGRC